MNHFYNMLDAQLVLMVYLVVGVFCRKKGIIDETAKDKLIDLILKITLPCMIFESFNSPLTYDVFRKAGLILLVALSIAILSYLTGKVAYNFMPPEKKSILQYCTMVNNSGFLGLPMVSAVYGDSGLFYASIFIIPNRILMWTAGISLFTEADKKNAVKNILLNPGIVAVYLGMGRRLAGIPVPDFLDRAVTSVGQITTPLSMIIIGTMLVGLTLKQLLQPVILYMSLIRLVLLPLAALVILGLLQMDGLLTGVSMIMTGMPAGATTALLAAKYGADEEFASQLVVTSTILSLVTTPLLMLLI
ncbi:MAG TPA: AEC family transporter [Lachnospiraceae bacterium]|nr:AEC family transporter [Lachnospiraceae bacterium]